ncbi:unnamed protein product (macronuclear) [Paramecium tetraurelia]|uniref:Uncharacterized protein n=1 Tax=Paramecium tetraurelia TaxID=5888 RepID=A0C7M8_PARTE|nr:uncharacterized protein GSPATT00035925001 [Paramecium tetraurelia]CAK66795.1 unnamed protein product [Paramecium tetraurelia]|eukprot:XP_001434192.1 hypothetical protein (macronuclear) [Paramecium tetraurelia strain d4-2]
MRTVILIVILIGIVQSAQHLRQKQSHILNGQKLALIEKQVQYIDDDVELNGQQEIQQEGFQEINVHEQMQVQIEEEAVIQIDEEQTLTAEQMEELDRKEQEEYERMKRQTLEEQHLNDEDTYMQSQQNESKKDNQYDPESEMPVDVVEHQLTPVIQKDPIPDQKGVISPFAPADNSLPYSSYDSESGFEVKESDIKMQGSISPNDLDQYLQEQYQKEMEQFANVPM